MTVGKVDVSQLTARQLDGLACVVCGAESGPMVTVPLMVGLSMIACAEPCAREVGGNVRTRGG